MHGHKNDRIGVLVVLVDITDEEDLLKEARKGRLFIRVVHTLLIFERSGDKRVYVLNLSLSLKALCLKHITVARALKQSDEHIRGESIILLYALNEIVEAEELFSVL